MIFFYPKASTPGCTQQACLLRDVSGQIGEVRIVGISPDKPAAQLRFDERNGLGYALLADTDHVVAEAFGVWQLKQLYGKSYMGIVRSAFLVSTTRGMGAVGTCAVEPMATSNASGNIREPQGDDKV